MSDTSLRRIDIADQSVIDQLFKDVGNSQHAVAVVLVGADGLAGMLPGVGATNLGKAEDAAHASGDVGVMLLAVRKDTPTALAGADGDYAPFEVDSAGRVHVRLPGSDVTNGVQKVSELNTVTITPITADGLVCPLGVGVIRRLFASNTHATETMTIQLYDNSAGSGTKIGGLILVPPISGQIQIDIYAPYTIGVWADLTNGTGSVWATYGGVL